MVCGQLLELLEGTGRGSQEILKPSSADILSQVLPMDSSGMAGLMQASPLPLEVDGSMLAPHAMQLAIRAPIRFFCPLCPKGFRSKLDMERHVRTHTGEKPFKCPYCPHRSATKGNLKSHLYHMHRNIVLPF
ncbi:Zinc finger protein 536 [Chionoecetes opilio]|uniref:Zinc finger protein 536 n=1 Tax=Chionoecetes opilio TaxID=41210 RepID=A0A8J5CZ49_CHIOP|nr:Zinc finger protein 536 [Chionoecetes opilio]